VLTASSGLVGSSLLVDSILSVLLRSFPTEGCLFGEPGLFSFVSSFSVDVAEFSLSCCGIGGQQDSRLHNVHLQDEIHDGKMTFDFKLHDGVVTKSNGIELMRLIGLKV